MSFRENNALMLKNTQFTDQCFGLRSIYRSSGLSLSLSASTYEMASSKIITKPYAEEDQPSKRGLRLPLTFNWSKSMGNSLGTHSRQHVIKSDSFICVASERSLLLRTAFKDSAYFFEITQQIQCIMTRNCTGVQCHGWIYNSEDESAIIELASAAARTGLGDESYLLQKLLRYRPGEISSEKHWGSVSFDSTDLGHISFISCAHLSTGMHSFDQSWMEITDRMYSISFVRKSKSNNRRWPSENTPLVRSCRKRSHHPQWQHVASLGMH